MIDINNKEKDILDRAISISNVIQNQFKKLSFLDALDFSDEKKYKQILSDTQLSQEVEEKILSELDLNNPDAVKKYVDYLTNNNPSEIGDIFNYIVRNIYSECKIPIANIRIADMISKDVFVQLLLDDPSLHNYRLAMLRNKVKTDMANAFLYYVEKLIEDRATQPIKPYLVQAKYNVDYLNLRPTGKELFAPSEGLVIYADSFVKNNNITPEFLKNVRTEFNLNRFTRFFSATISTSDNTLEINEIFAQTLLAICLVKSILLISDEDIFDKYLEIIDKHTKYILEDPDKLSKDKKIRIIGPKLLRDSIEEVKIDRKNLIKK